MNSKEARQPRIMCVYLSFSIFWGPLILTAAVDGCSVFRAFCFCSVLERQDGEKEDKEKNRQCAVLARRKDKIE